MGRQINFYMSEKIQMDFIEFLEQNKFIFLNYNGEILNSSFWKKIFSLYLYKYEYGEIIMCKEGGERIDSRKSSVIHFNKTNVKEEQKKISRGRLWIENQYYDDEGKLVRKEEKFIKDYQMLIRWIKKNVPYQQIRKDNYFTNEYINDELKELQEKGYAFTL